MKKITISKRERRIIIVLMSINLFALFVNYFGMSPKFDLKDNYASNIGRDEAFILTDAGTTYLTGERNVYNVKLYNWKSTKAFWPFTEYYIEENKSVDNSQQYPNLENKKEYYSESRFRGIFADFDHTEFLVYTLLIFGIVIVRKLW
ncbi:hypothetical protein [Polaribacter sp.]|uniref:hypothetical protein n=1 Tax=Polaribacter sp. TaxID=1920175 RepID=UPI0040484840